VVSRLTASGTHHMTTTLSARKLSSVTRPQAFRIPFYYVSPLSVLRPAIWLSPIPSQYIANLTETAGPESTRGGQKDVGVKRDASFHVNCQVGSAFPQSSNNHDDIVGGCLDLLECEFLGKLGFSCKACLDPLFDQSQPDKAPHCPRHGTHSGYFEYSSRGRRQSSVVAMKSKPPFVACPGFLLSLLLSIPSGLPL
jgi:hypothetical protein